MRNVSRDQAVANFEELVSENQIQPAVEMLIAAEPEDQVFLIEQASPLLLERLFQSLPAKERAEAVSQLSETARLSLVQVLELSGVHLVGVTKALDQFLADRAAEEIRESGAEPPLAVPRAMGIPSARRKDFVIADGRLYETTPGNGVITIYSNPSAQEQRQLVEVLGVDDHALASALDPEEISRIEFEDEERETFVVWTRPRRETSDVPELLELASMAFFLRPDYLTIVTQHVTPLLEEGDRADNLRNVMLRIMSSTVNEFIVELKTIKRTSQDIGEKLARSLENRHLLRMFDLSEGLIYHINALEANGGVLRRLRGFSTKIGLSEADQDFLEDIIVDNTQCVSQARTFSTVLAGLMDARGNLINNNMNMLLKNLTILNVVFLPLGVIASVGGMSEYSVWLDEYGISWQVGYAAFTVGMFVLAFALLKGVNFWIDRMFRR